VEYAGNGRNFHGHNYQMEFAISRKRYQESIAPPPPSDMVCNFTEVEKICKEFIDAEVDHSTILTKNDPIILALGMDNLEKVLGKIYFLPDKIINSTAEAVAQTIARPLTLRLKKATGGWCSLRELTLWETPNSAAHVWWDREYGFIW